MARRYCTGFTLNEVLFERAGVSNAGLAGKLDSPPAIGALRLPAGAPWDVLLEAHHRRVKNYLAKHPGVTPIKLENASGCSRAQKEQQRIKSEFRKRVGLTKAELERIAGTKDPKLDGYMTR